jgi:hypothetical protein
LTAERLNKGIDNIGLWSSQTFIYKTATGRNMFVTTIKVYEDFEAVAFGQVSKLYN